MAARATSRADAHRRWELAARAANPDGPLPFLAGPEEDPYTRSRDRLGFPGEAPFTRGIQPTMYRGRLWTFRQYAGFGSAAATNRRYRYLLAHGQTGLSVAFDLPTQIGYDSDHTRSKGEVGRCGVPIAHLGDMQTLLRSIPLDKVTVSMTINATAPILTALLVAVAEGTGVPRAKVGGTVQNDILKEYIARGTYIYPPAPSMRLTVDLIEFATREMPQWNYLSVSGYHMREAGATASQEIAFTLANAIAYVRAVKSRGLDVDEFLPRLSFFFSSDRNFLEEIAKFRAARRLWATIAADVLGAKSARSRSLRFHTQTAGSSLTAQQPELNVVRTTLEALAAVLGGTQSLHTNALDEALGLPTSESARLALRTQQLLAEESGVASTVDPVGGSWAIEAMTDRLQDEAERYLDQIEAMGGALVAVERGFQASEIAREAYRVARRREAKEELVIGVNAFPEGNDWFSLTPSKGRTGTTAQRITPADEAAQLRRIAQWRSHRAPRRVAAALAALATATEKGENVMPQVLAALRARATLGEIADIWRQQFGEHEPLRAFWYSEEEIVQVDHIGIAVRSISHTMPQWERTLGVVGSPPEEVPSQKVRVAFLAAGETHLEFLEPTHPESAVGKFLEARGEGMHHIAFEVPSVDTKLAELAREGARLIDTVSRPGARGRRVGFVHPSTMGGVLVEFVEVP